MLQVQDYLKTHTLEELNTSLGIKSTVHPALPLVILNYSQIDSPKTDPIVRECRGLVLEVGTWNLVARAFSRFFNWGEVQEEMKLFDFSNCSTQTKEDGSLALIYRYRDEWRINTRGSFAEDPMQFQTFTWKEAIVQALGVANLQKVRLHPDYTYVCEFCSPWNKVVRRYTMPDLYLLSMFQGEYELSIDECDDAWALRPDLLLRPQQFKFNNIEQVQEHLAKQAECDPTYEGVVIRDWQNFRWKVKSPTYLGLHRLKGEGDNIFNPKHLLPFVLTGEKDELLTYFPECQSAYQDTEKKVQDAFAQLQAVWEQYYAIPSQKDFALAILGKTPFTGILFTLRKELGDKQTPEELKKLWRNSTQTIIKVLF